MAARTAGGYDLVVRTGKLGLGRLLVDQIAEWLARIGLERYTPAFIDNDIDVEVLRYVTDADLEKIGVEN